MKSIKILYGQEYVILNYVKTQAGFQIPDFKFGLCLYSKFTLIIFQTNTQFSTVMAHIIVGTET